MNKSTLTMLSFLEQEYYYQNFIITASHNRSVKEAAKVVRSFFDSKFCRGLIDINKVDFKYIVKFYTRG